MRAYCNATGAYTLKKRTLFVVVDAAYLAWVSYWYISYVVANMLFC